MLDYETRAGTRASEDGSRFLGPTVPMLYYLCSASCSSKTVTGLNWKQLVTSVQSVLPSPRWPRPLGPGASKVTSSSYLYLSHRWAADVSRAVLRQLPEPLWGKEPRLPP